MTEAACCYPHTPPAQAKVKKKTCTSSAHISPPGWPGCRLVAGVRKRERRRTVVHTVHRLGRLVGATHAEKSSGLTVREIARARKAREFILAMHFPSEKVAKEVILRHADDHNDHNRITVTDISNAFKLYLSELSRAGKAVDKTAEDSTEDPDPFDVHLKRQQNLYGDLMHVAGYWFLVTVSAPMYRTMIDIIPDRSFKSVTDALTLHVQRYKTKGVAVRKVFFDGERALTDKDKVEKAIGTEYIVLPPKHHVHIVERRLRTVKERARATIALLHYMLPRSLMPALISAVVYRLNSEPTSQRYDNATPNEIWTSRKLSVPNECGFHFGQYVTVTVPLDEIDKHGLSARVQRALTLAPCEGGWLVLLLDSWRVVRRKGSGIESHHIPDDIIHKLNMRAQQEAARHVHGSNKDALAAQPLLPERRTRALVLSEPWDYGGSSDEVTPLTSVAQEDMIFTEQELQEAGLSPQSPPPTSDQNQHDVRASHVQIHQESAEDGEQVAAPMVTDHDSPTLAVTTTDDGKQQLHEQPHDRDDILVDSVPQGPDDVLPQAHVTRTEAEQRANDSSGEEAQTNSLAHSAHGGKKDRNSSPAVGHVTADKPYPPGQDDDEALLPTPRAVRRQLARKITGETNRLLSKMYEQDEAKTHPAQDAEGSSAENRAEKPSTSRFGRTNKSRFDYRNPRRPSAMSLSPKKAEEQYGADQVWQAIADEITQLLDREVFEPVYKRFLSTEQRRKIIKSKIFLKAKTHPDGYFLRLKARLVARGDMQMKASYDSLYSPTGSLESALTILAIAAYEKRAVRVIDLVGAYLTVPVQDDTETYVELDARMSAVLFELQPATVKYATPEGTFIGKLKKSLYGTVDAARNLSQKIRDTMINKLKAVPNPKDMCVYNWRSRRGKQVTCVVYVDDILITADSDSDIDEFLRGFTEHHPDVTQKTGLVIDYLGMKLDLSTKGSIVISMPDYTRRVSDLFERSHQDAVRERRPGIVGPSFKRCTAPCNDDLFKVDPSSPLLDKKMQETFHTVVATVMYAAKRSRPDLLCTASALSLRVARPNADDWSKLRRLVSYAKATAEKGLTLRPKGIWVEAYTDASFAVHMDMKSHSGIVCTVGGAPFYVSSTRQRINAKSAAEAEMIAISTAGTMIQWGVQFLEHQGYRHKPATVWEDNQATLDNLDRGNCSGANSRHYDVRYFYLTDLARRGIIRYEHLPSEDMTADLLTKGVSNDIFQKLAHKIMTSESDVAAQEAASGAGGVKRSDDMPPTGPSRSTKRTRFASSEDDD
jgi:hypothetical protein